MTARVRLKLLAWLVVVAMPLLACITAIQVNEVGVVMDNLTGNLSDPISPGSHLINPLTQQLTIYSTAQQVYILAGNDAVEVRTSDGQQVLIDISILFRIDPEQVNMLHARWGSSYLDNFIRPATRSIVRDVASQYKVEAIYAEYRLDLESDIQTRLDALFAEEGFILDEVLIRDVTFEEWVVVMLEMKAVATQQAEQSATAAFIATAEQLILTVPAQMTPTPIP